MSASQRRGAAIGVIIFATIISFGVALACRVAAGATLGAFIGPVLFAAILTPPLVLMDERRGQQALSAGGVVIGIVPVWLASGLSLSQGITCIAVLFALVFALWGLAALLDRILRNPVFAAAVAILLGLLWLTWPVWLSRGLIALEHPDRMVAWLVPANPPLLISSIIDRGIWSEQRLAYQLTNLGQDIAYRPTTHPWSAIVVHGIVGVACLLLLPKRVVGATFVSQFDISPKTGDTSVAPTNPQ